MPTVTIEPNEKYRYVVTGERPSDSQTVPDSGNTPYDSARSSYQNAVQEAQRQEGEVPPQPLSWSGISPPRDSNVLDMMATYFDGIEPTDATDLIRAKLRLCPVEYMKNAQTAAEAEMNDQNPTTQ